MSDSVYPGLLNKRLSAILRVTDNDRSANT